MFCSWTLQSPRPKVAKSRRRRSDDDAEATEEDEAKTSMRVFVGNLPFTTTQDELADAFAGVAGSSDAEIVTSKTGRSKG